MIVTLRGASTMLSSVPKTGIERTRSRENLLLGCDAIDAYFVQLKNVVGGGFGGVSSGLGVKAGSTNERCTTANKRRRFGWFIVG